MNPLLDRDKFVPDAEARVMPDGRIYLYGSWDIGGKHSYCSDRYHVFSSEDMLAWTDHGEIFSTRMLKGDREVALYAPDCIHKDGKYYLYYCTSSQGEGVAVSDGPAGPFTDMGGINIADGDGIDPAVFVDDDGTPYYFWGQFRLRGARLSDDMCHIDEETVTRDLLTEWEHGFHEGACVRKRGDKYYIVYTDITRGRATCLSYAWSHSPLGPYTKGGVIMDNTGCDPQSWNNHGSIAEFRGQWYVFYHRSSRNSIFSRRVCAEPIFFDEKGMISEVPMTSSGAGMPLDGVKYVDAANLSRLKTPFGGDKTGVFIDADERSEFLNNIRAGDWMEYRTVLLPKGVEAFSVEYAAAADCTLEVFADGKQISTLALKRSDGWSTAAAPAVAVEGERILCIRLEGGGGETVCKLRGFNFR